MFSPTTFGDYMKIVCEQSFQDALFRKTYETHCETREGQKGDFELYNNSKLTRTNLWRKGRRGTDLTTGGTEVDDLDLVGVELGTNDREGAVSAL